MVFFYVCWPVRRTGLKVSRAWGQCDYQGKAHFLKARVTLQRVPVDPQCTGACLMRANCEIFKNVINWLMLIKLVASKQPCGRIYTMELANVTKQKSLLLSFKEPIVKHFPTYHYIVHNGKHGGVGPREVGMGSMDEAAGGDGSKQRWSE